MGALKVIAGKKQLSAGTMKKKGSQQMGKHVKSFVTEVKKNRALFVMAMPAFLLVLIMQYLPMSGLVLAFKNYRYDLGVFGSEESMKLFL